MFRVVKRMVGTGLAIGFALPGMALASPAEEAMLAEIDQARAGRGLPGLRESPDLSESAGAYSRYMIARDYFGHLSSIRMSDRFSLKGEILAWHSGDNARVGPTFRNWMSSSAHRAVLLHPKMRLAGAGLARGRLGGREVTVWTIHFARP
jgi:uncharacterized protein YkwD